MITGFFVFIFIVIFLIAMASEAEMFIWFLVNSGMTFVVICPGPGGILFPGGGLFLAGFLAIPCLISWILWLVNLFPATIDTKKKIDYDGKINDLKGALGDGRKKS